MSTNLLGFDVKLQNNFWLLNFLGKLPTYLCEVLNEGLDGLNQKQSATGQEVLVAIG